MSDGHFDEEQCTSWDRNELGRWVSIAQLSRARQPLTDGHFDVLCNRMVGAAFEGPSTLERDAWADRPKRSTQNSCKCRCLISS